MLELIFAMAACPIARSLLPSPTMHGVWKQAGIHVQQGGRESVLLVPGIASLRSIPSICSELKPTPAAWLLREFTRLHLALPNMAQTHSKGIRPKMTL
jgi:hypothetical protein